MEAFPIFDMRTKTFTIIFLQEVICRLGVLLEIYTDEGRNFDAKLVEEFAYLSGIFEKPG